MEDLRNWKKNGLGQWLFVVREAALDMGANKPDADKKWNKVCQAFEEFFFQNYKSRRDYEEVWELCKWLRKMLDEENTKKKVKDAVLQHVENLVDASDRAAYEETNFWQKKNFVKIA